MVPSRYLRSFPSTRDIGEPLLDLQREMSRLFDDVVRNSFWPLSAAQQAAQQAVQQGLTLAASPRVDLQESDEDLLVTVDLPGVEQSDVEVKMEGDTLIICGEKRADNEQKQQNFHLMERSYGRFERSVALPFSPNPDQAEARYENGVLTVRLPKQEEECSRRIEVQPGRAQSHGRSREQQGSQQYLSERDRERAGASVQFSAESQQNEPSGSRSSAASSTSGSGSQAHKSSTERKQPQPA